MQDCLAPFLALAGPLSDGIAITTFLDYWGSLPWEQATLPLQRPAAIADLSEAPISVEQILTLAAEKLFLILMTRYSKALASNLSINACEILPSC